MKRERLDRGKYVTEDVKDYMDEGKKYIKKTNAQVSKGNSSKDMEINKEEKNGNVTQQRRSENMKQKSNVDGWRARDKQG